MRHSGHSWLDSLLGAAVTVLLACVALYVAARLVAAVWPVLVVAGGLVALGIVLGRWWLWRSSGW